MRLIDADAFMERLKYMKELNARHPLEKEQLDDKEVNNYEVGQEETFELAMEHLKIQPTAFDLESVIEKLEEVAMKEMGINKSQFAMDREEYRSYCSLTLSDVEEILKSAANATNGKNGG